VVADDPQELLVVVDRDDNVLGLRTRGECHADPALLHRSVYVHVETADGVVFQRRGFAKDSAPGAWDLACGGHVGPGETAGQAAARELVEELGLEAATPEPLGRTVLELPGETELCTVFRLRHDGPFVVRTPEVAGVAVHRPGELPAPLAPGARHVLAWLAEGRMG
jgi:isopentenyldiphosphate isomerase